MNETLFLTNSKKIPAKIGSKGNLQRFQHEPSITSKKSRTANSTCCTLKTLTNIIANVYAGSNRKGDMRKKWLILASCVRFRTSHHALARSVQLSPRRRAAASARSRLQGAYRCTHAGLRPPSRARAGQPTTRTGPNVRSPYLTTSYVASLSPQPLPEPVSEPMQQTCLPTASEEPSHVPQRLDEVIKTTPQRNVSTL